VATSEIPSGLVGDPDQPARLGCAQRMLAELERTAFLTGRPLRRPEAARALRTPGSPPRPPPPYPRNPTRPNRPKNKRSSGAR
jgi:hypothetical protein